MCIKFGYSEMATKFEKIFHLKFDAIQLSNVKGVFSKPSGKLILGPDFCFSS